MTRKVVGVLGIIGCLLFAGCASTSAPVDLVGVNSAQPVLPPSEAQGSAAVPPSKPNADCGNPVASLTPNPAGGPALNAIKKRGMLIAGVDESTYLFGFRNPNTGVLEGFDIDIVHDIARAIFGDPNKVQFKVLTSAQRDDALKNKTVDIVVRTMTITCARKQFADFSGVYYNAQQRVLVSNVSNAHSLDDLGGKKVCATTGSTSLSTIAANKSHPIPVGVTNWSDCLVMLQQREVDAISTDDSILAGMHAQDPNNTKIVGPSLAAEPYGVAIPKGEQDLVRYVNSVLDSVRGGAWMASYNHWLSHWLGPIGGPPAPVYNG
ncbi:MAG: transporter substrate-binding domain-containing protein [Sciscionella sp.]|nr:transporter substrate-binding domain-containing protein [Sciscionella sp.]